MEADSGEERWEWVKQVISGLDWYKLCAKAAPTHFAALHWPQSMREVHDPLQPLHELLCKQEHPGESQWPVLPLWHALVSLHWLLWFAQHILQFLCSNKTSSEYTLLFSINKGHCPSCQLYVFPSEILQNAMIMYSVSTVHRSFWSCTHVAHVQKFKLVGWA